MQEALRNLNFAKSIAEKGKLAVAQTVPFSVTTQNPTF
jgi:hypothetical protein